MTKDKIIRLIALFVALLVPLSAKSATNYPSWWTNRSVITNSAVNDYAPVNAGQLKWVAMKAYDELQTNLPGGAGTSAASRVSTFTMSNNYVQVNLGQLKYVAAPFYQQLIFKGYTNAVPWTTNTVGDDADFAPANLGQLKNVFSFDVTRSTDGDSLPDWWELRYFGDLDEVETGDYDNDGLKNLDEYVAGTDPTVSNQPTSPLPYTNSFEVSEGFVVGNLNGQGGWLSSVFGADVVSNVVRAGDQATRLAGCGSYANHAFSSANTTIISEMYIYLSDASVFPPAATNIPASASAVVSYDPSQGLMAFNGAGNGTGTWVLASGTLLPNQWVCLRVEQDYTTKQWNLVVNGTPKLSGLGFSDNSINQLTRLYLRGGSAGEVFCDDVAVTGQ